MDSKKIKLPKDLGIKFGSKTEAKWLEVQERTEDSIIADKINLKISEAIMKICKVEIAKEKEKFKKEIPQD